MNHEPLVVLIDNLRTDRAWVSWDEEKIKQGVIFKVLDRLGWDTYDVNEITPQYSVEGGRVDYALAIRGRPKVFVEAKRGQEELGEHEGQLLDYAFKQGVPLAVLTNGAKWWMYLATAEGSWDQRKFYSIDILEQESAEVAARFVDFLSKENVASDKAEEAARRLHKGTQRDRIIRETLPEAWRGLISEPNGVLVDLIVETTESICGYKPGADQVKDFLHEHREQFALQQPPPQPPARTRRTVGAVVRPPSPRPRGEGWAGKTIRGFSLAGQEHRVATWRQLLVSLCQMVFSKQRSDYLKCLQLRGRRSQYFSRDGGGMRAPLQVSGFPVFVEGNLSANAIVGLCHKLLNLFGHRPQELKVLAD